MILCFYSKDFSREKAVWHDNDELWDIGIDILQCIVSRKCIARLACWGWTVTLLNSLPNCIQVFSNMVSIENNQQCKNYSEPNRLAEHREG